MNITLSSRAVIAPLLLTLLMVLPTRVDAYSPKPDLTAAGAIATLKTDPNASPKYGETYNLGPTGLRGWIYLDRSSSGGEGLQTDLSRQILVTVASTPASAVLAVDDVILGAMAANSGSVPLFTGDCRKAFGAAITEAEKTGAGTLRVKRWRAGSTTDVNIPIAIMGDYTATAPYSCPKSAAILAGARTHLVSELLADPNFLTTNYAGAVSGLALLAGVVPGDADYAAVQTRLQSFAQLLGAQTPTPAGLYVWHWGYTTLFLSEYYLSTGDAGALPGIEAYTVALAKVQSRYGTFGHGGALPKDDGSLHGAIAGYGPVNSAGIVANIGIVMGKKALLAGGQAIDPEIDPAIQRGADYFASYVNRGSIPYGEHGPWMRHDSNGKNPMCAVLFGLQDSRVAETEYYARMTLAGYTGRESGHTGQGFSYLWEAMGANMGGPEAVANYLQQARWHLDLSRRTDGSFAYDGAEQYGGGKTADGTYLGASSYNGLNPTASQILSFALPLQRLHVTGKTPNPAHVLDPAKVDNALAAATYKRDCPAHSTDELIAALSEFDPLVRHNAAIELATRSLNAPRVNTLLAMVTAADANARMGACQVLGLIRNPSALPMLAARLSDPVPWVRAKAAEALRWYEPADAATQLTPMMTAFIANATDPYGVVWDDPIQMANTQLSFALFGDAVYGYQVNGGANLASYTINAPESLLYPAIRAGLKQPDSNPRLGVARFCRNHLALEDVQALAPDLFELITTMSQADRMWSHPGRAEGIRTLANFHVAEGIAMALDLQDVPPDWGWSKTNIQLPGLDALETYGDAARWTLPALREMVATWDGSSTSYLDALTSTIDSIEAAITSPSGINKLLAVADPQVVTTTGPAAITLTGNSCRGDSVSFTLLSLPAHGTLSGTEPNLLYTPSPGYSGPDHFTFQTADTLTTSEPGTVSIIVGAAGTGLKGEYYNNADFSNLKLTRTDSEVNFDWGTGSPHGSMGADTFSVRWSGLLLVPESGTYTFSTLNSDGVRLYADGVAVVDDYVDQVTNWEDGTAVELTEGQLVDLHMIYYEDTGPAVAKLKWTGPSFAGANGLPIATEWLSEGAGVRTPHAHAQSVTLIQNTSTAVTLTGSGADPGVLSYAIVTPPAHGSLSGTAPHLTYTPAANYSGTDSFTFLVNNGNGDSDPATVSIGIWAGEPEDYYWANAVSGNWSGASSWVNSSGGTVAPAATGQANYVLHFDQPGSYTTTQDLNNGFLFNQLNLAAAVTLDGTNSLSPAGNGPVLPRINQGSGSEANLNATLDLATDTTIGGNGAGQVNLAGLISGPGGLIKDGPGILKVYGLTPNSFTGGTVINSGILNWGTMVGGISPPINSALGTGTVTLNPGGTLEFDRVDNATNALTLNGGMLHSNNGWGATWSGPVTLSADSTIKATWKMTITGNISGTGGITKTGGRTLTLSGTNSFTGANQVTAGTLSCSRAAALGTGALDISTGAMVDLDYAGTRTIEALTLGGSPQAPGTYGSSASGASNQDDTWFSGTGTVNVPMPPYESWAADPAHGLTAGVNDGPLDDPDLDGIANLLEFVLGGNPLVASSAILPTTSSGAGGTWLFEYERSNLSEFPVTTQVVEYGSDLLGWTPVAIPLTSAGTVTITPGSPSDHVSVALPDLGAAGFARLMVSE